MARPFADIPRRASLGAALLTLAALGCKADPSSDAAVAQARAATSASLASDSGRGPSAMAAGGPNAAGAGPGREGGATGGAGGGRPSPSITLAAGDVATVGRTTVEEAIAINGDLRPLETITVRARIEGDLEAVYVREGQQVSAGQLLARFEATEQESSRASAVADRTSAQSDLSTARWNLEQTQALFKQGAVAERDLRTAQQAVTAAQARVAAADARLRAASNQSRDTRVVAPASGVVEKRLVQPGEHLSRGATLFTVVRGETLELAASVPARAANSVRAGQLVHFAVDGQRLDGRVARVSPTIDPATRSATVYVQVPNPGSRIKGGSFASGRVVTREVGGTLAIPVAALRQAPDKQRPFVYRIANDRTEVAEVTLGVTDEQQGIAQVLEGLREGDRVIVGNVGTLGRGMKVTIAGSREKR